ncbi:F0F1 ATP synthase subunit delta [Candidatus Woesebacteria bacterium]|nr:F0F1 ATP synthase subunit delta [Candidatus Woesebacteria bacterium]
MGTLDLTEFFTTKAESNDFSARLANLASNLYKLDKDLEKGLQEQLGYQKKDKFLSLLRECDIPLDSNQEITKFIENIVDEISSMPEATITIAIEPDKEILKTIADWFILNLKKQVLIKITADSNLIAGAAVDYQGSHVEFAVNKELDTLFSTKPQNIKQKDDENGQKRYYVETQNNLQYEKQNLPEKESSGHISKDTPSEEISSSSSLITKSEDPENPRSNPK